MADNLKFNIDIATGQSAKNLKDTAKAAAELGTALDTSQTKAQRVAAQLSATADVIKSGMAQAATASEALAKSLGPEFAQQIGSNGLEDLITKLQATGLTFDEITADADALAAAVRKLDTAGRGAGSGLADPQTVTQLGAVGTATEHIDEATGKVVKSSNQAKQAVGQFAGQSITELSNLTGAVGSVSAGLGQMSNYALQGGVGLSTAVAAGLGFAAVGLIVDALGDSEKRIAELHAFKADEVKAYVSALRDGDTAAAALAKRIEDTGKAIFVVNSGLDEFDIAQDKIDLTDVFARNGVTVTAFADAVAKGRPGVDALQAALESAGVSAADETKIISAARNEADLYATSQERLAKITSILGISATQVGDVYTIAAAAQTAAADAAAAATAKILASAAASGDVYTIAANAQEAAGDAATASAAKIVNAAEQVAGTGDVYSIAARAQQGYVDQVDTTAAEAARLTRATEVQAKAVTDAAVAAVDSATRWNGYERTLAGLAAATDTVARESAYLQTALSDVAAQATGSERANLNLDDSYAKLRQSRKDNGKSVAEDTQKGRDNQRAILDTADAIRDNLVQQLKDSGGSYDQVTRAADEYRGQLKDQLKQFGITGKAADDYIAKLGLAPDQITTTIELAGQAKAKDDLATLGVNIDDIPAEKKTEFLADVTTGDYDAALTLFKQLALPGGHGRDVPFNATTDTTAVDGAIHELEQEHVVPVSANTTEAKADIHDLDGTVVKVVLRPIKGNFATGTKSAKPGLAEVAEDWPEIIEDKDGAVLVKKRSLVVLKGGERIYNGRETAAILAGGAGTGSGTKIPAYAGGAGFGGTYDASQITIVSTPAPATGDPAKVADDAVKEQDRIQAAMYETGRISLDAYRKYAQGRLATSADLSDDWLQQYRLVKSLNDQEAQSNDAKAQAAQDAADAVKKATDDQIAAQDELEKNMRDLGVITAQEYEDYLKGRLGSFQAYTDGYTQIYKQIQQIDDDEAAAQKQRIKDAEDETKAIYTQAQAAKNAADAEAERSNAFNDVLVSGAAGDRVQKDRHATDADRAQAVQDFIDKQTKLADDTYKAVLASATSAGLDVGSIPWDRFVRAALASFIGQYGDLEITAPLLQSQFNAIPALATGGTVKGSTAGTLAIIGDKNRDEHIVRDDPLRTLTEAVTAMASQTRGNSVQYITLNMPAGSDANANVTALRRHDRRNGTSSGYRPLRVAVGR